MDSITRSVIGEMRSARTAPAMRSPQSFSGDLKIVRKSGGIIVGVAAFTPGSREAHKSGMAFCARRGEKVLTLDGKDYELVASWTGAPIVKSSPHAIRVLESDEELDPNRLVGISLSRGDESAWFVTLRKVS